MSPGADQCERPEAQWKRTIAALVARHTEIEINKERRKPRRTTKNVGTRKKTSELKYLFEQARVGRFLQWASVH